MLTTIWLAVLSGVSRALHGLQRPVERLSNRLFRWYFLLRNHVAGRRASR